MRKWLAIFLVLILLTGCSQMRVQQGKGTGQIAKADAINSYNQFGFNLYKTLANSEENRLFSPLSVALALSMAYNGAAGETRDAIAHVLQVTNIKPEDLNQSNKLLLQELQAADVTVEIANSFWMRQGIPFLPDFIELLQTYYAAQVSDLDFASAEAVTTINQWVRDNTNGLIEQIIQGPINPLTVSFLLNAVYFQGDWSNPFAAMDTEADTFYSPTGPVTVPFMHKTATYDFLQEDGLQAIRLPYGKGNMAMYVFLPEDLTEFQMRLTQEQWAKWRSAFTSARGELALPKFKFECEKTLNEALTALGMGPAFASDVADFSNMVEGGNKVHISELKHKAFIQVDEKGTEAAAVTSVEFTVTSMPPAPTFTMKVDRPFFFMIHDQQTDSILFMGTVCNPSE